MVIWPDHQHGGVLVLMGDDHAGEALPSVISLNMR